MLQWVIWAMCLKVVTLTRVSYEMLSEGQTITVPLQNYFENAAGVSLNRDKSSPDFEKSLKLTNSSSPFSNVTEIEMSVLINNVKINFNEHSYYASKTIYNQPVKIFLLDNNILMMYVYTEHCTDDEKVPKA